MVPHRRVRRNTGGKLPVSIKYQNLHSFKEGMIHLCQSILETRRISHLHGSAAFTIPLNSARLGSRKKPSVMALTLSVLIPDKERKLTSIFIFTLLCGASEGFMKVLKTFIKPFEAPQRSLKIKVLS